MADMDQKEKYTPERLKGLREHRPPLQDGERSEKWRVRTRSDEDYEWFKTLSAADRGELVRWARETGWTPTPEEPEEPTS